MILYDHSRISMPFLTSKFKVLRKEFATDFGVRPWSRGTKRSKCRVFPFPEQVKSCEER